jgi:hypothetical protein
MRWCKSPCLERFGFRKRLTSCESCCNIESCVLMKPIGSMFVEADVLPDLYRLQ